MSLTILRGSQFKLDDVYAPLKVDECAHCNYQVIYCTEYDTSNCLSCDLFICNDCTEMVKCEKCTEVYCDQCLDDGKCEECLGESD